jgi:hypothetical protein
MSQTISQRLRRIDRLIWYVIAAVVLAFIGVIIPWLLTRNNLAPGWTSAKVAASVRQCNTQGYPQPSGPVSAAACRCVTQKASHTIPLKVSSYATQNAGQVQIAHDTADCNRAHPAASG